MAGQSLIRLIIMPPPPPHRQKCCASRHLLLWAAFGTFLLVQLGLNYTVTITTRQMPQTPSDESSFRMKFEEKRRKLTTTEPSTTSRQNAIASLVIQKSSENNNRSTAPVIATSNNIQRKRKMKDKDRFTKLFFFDEDGMIHERAEAIRPKRAGHNITSSVSSNDNDINLGYPFIPQSILSRCGMDEFGVSAAAVGKKTPAWIPLNRSLGYIRPHKTGSTTIKGVIHRILYGRGMIDMVSTDKTYLGWPGSFSVEEVVGLENVLSKSKYDAFTHHSVLNLNRSSYQEYLRQPLCLFTILREPVARTISAFHFFMNDDSDDGEFTDWREFIDRYRPMTTIQRWKPAVFLNNLAFTLGWYHQEHIQHSTHLDRNVTEINNFIAKVDNELDHVMILEQLVESLILWKHLVVLELTLPELVWYDRNAEHKKKTYPTDEERDELKDMLLLDRMIYAHFKSKLERQWQEQTQQYPELVRMKESLQCVRQTVVELLDKDEAEEEQLLQLPPSDLTHEIVLPETTKEYFTLPAVQYTRMLRTRQLERFGCDRSSICPD